MLLGLVGVCSETVNNQLEILKKKLHWPSFVDWFEFII